MSKQYKTSYKLYPAWFYKEKIAEYNKASEEGWQLIKAGCLRSKFVYNKDIQYRYQMDFRKIEDKGRYMETFREQGWEYIDSTWNGWHFFRKIYNPALSAEDYEIFTDQESLREMKKRWEKRMTILFGVVVLLLIMSMIPLVKTPQLPILITTLTVVVEALVILRGMLIMRNSEADHRDYSDGYRFKFFLLILFLGTVFSSEMEKQRPDFRTQQQAYELEEPLVDHRWMDVDIKYTDYYYFGLDIKAEEPLTFSLINEQEEVVYTVTATELQEEDIRMKLTPGTYDYSIDCSSGFNIYVYVD